MGNRIIGEIVGRLEPVDIEFLISQIETKYLREKFLHIFKYMMKDGDEHYLLVKPVPEDEDHYWKWYKEHYGRDYPDE